MKTFRLILALLLPVLMGSVPALRAADNLIFNGSFELGQAGFECNKYLHLKTNPTMVYEGPLIDSTTAASGTNSLKIPNHYNEGIDLFARGVSLKPSTAYTVSISMKSTVSSLPVTVSFCGNDNTFNGIDTFTVGTTWQRYSFTFTTNATEVIGHVPWLQCDFDETAPSNDLWIDDFQINEGAAQPYQTSAERQHRDRFHRRLEQFFASRAGEYHAPNE